MQSDVTTESLSGSNTVFELLAVLVVRGLLALLVALLVGEHESLCVKERLDFMFPSLAERHSYLDYHQQAYDVRSFIDGSPVMVAFHSVVKCLRALSESRRVNSLLVAVTRLHLLVV